jgi:ParB-like chromosome segregation protein Spo0J
MDLEYHEAANLFPLMEGEAFEAFVASIQKTRGNREPIKLLDGKILDGRNRYRACQRLGIKPVVKHLPADTDPVAYVINANLNRFHYSERQRAMLAGRVANLRREDTLKQNRDTDPSIDGSVSRDDAARMLNVSTASVDRAKLVLSQGVPELVRAVDDGEVAVSTAAVVATLPAKEQERLVAEGAPAVRKKATEMRESNNGHAAAGKGIHCRPVLGDVERLVWLTADKIDTRGDLQDLMLTLRAIARNLENRIKELP